MAKAKKLSSGSWRVQVYNGKNSDGKNEYISITATSEKEANYLALQHQLHYKEVSRDSRNMTVDEAMDAYIKSKSNILSPASIRTYKMLKKKHYVEIKQLRLCKLTQALVQKTINTAAETCAPKTVSSIHGFLSSVLKEYHPTLQLQTTLPAKKRKPQTIYTGEQIAALIDAVNGESIEIPVLLAVWLGLRRSEILGLRWERVDFEKKTITIDTAMVRGEDGMTPKGTKTFNSTRVLPLPSYIAERIKRHPQTGEFIITLHGEYLLQRLYEIEDRNNLPRLGLHKLRHTNASIMLALNIADKYAMERGGWATNYTMKNIYQHTMSDERITVDSAIDGYFEKLISHEISHTNSECLEPQSKA